MFLCQWSTLSSLLVQLLIVWRSIVRLLTPFLFFWLASGDSSDSCSGMMDPAHKAFRWSASHILSHYETQAYNMCSTSHILSQHEIQACNLCSTSKLDKAREWRSVSPQLFARTSNLKTWTCYWLKTSSRSVQNLYYKCYLRLNSPVYLL